MSIALISLINYLINTNPVDSTPSINKDKESTQDRNPEMAEPHPQQTPAKTQQLNNKVLQKTTGTTDYNQYENTYNDFKIAQETYKARLEDITRTKKAVHSAPIKGSEKRHLEENLQAIEKNFKMGNLHHTEMSDLNFGKVQLNILSSEVLPEIFSYTNEWGPMIHPSTDMMDQVYQNTVEVSDFRNANVRLENTDDNGHNKKSQAFNNTGRKMADEIASKTPIVMPKGTEYFITTHGSEGKENQSFKFDVDAVVMHKSLVPKGVNILQELPAIFIITPRPLGEGRSQALLLGDGIKLLPNGRLVPTYKTEGAHVVVEKPITITKGRDFYIENIDGTYGLPQRENGDVILVPKNQVPKDVNILQEFPAGSAIFDTDSAGGAPWSKIPVDPNTDYVLLSI